MNGVLLTSSAARSLAVSGHARIGADSPEEKRPLRGSDCECEADERKPANDAATQSSAVPPLSTDAILALQGIDTGEPVSLKDKSEAIAQDASEAAGQDESKPASAGQTEDNQGGNKSDGLSAEEEKQVEKLKQRDREVRAHEHAHARTGGGYAGAPSYTYQQGPDGKRYAIGGEVSIDTSSERTPEATVRKMQVVIRAATAPAEPSSQDLKVAQQARAQLQEAQAELRQERAAEQSGEEEGGGKTDAGVSAAAEADPDGADDGQNQDGADQGGVSGKSGFANGSSNQSNERGSSSVTKAYSDALQLFRQASEDRAGARLTAQFY